jgi:hypothetical protein
MHPEVASSSAARTARCIRSAPPPAAHTLQVSYVVGRIEERLDAGPNDSLASHWWSHRTTSLAHGKKSPAALFSAVPRMRGTFVAGHQRRDFGGLLNTAAQVRQAARAVRCHQGSVWSARTRNPVVTLEVTTTRNARERTRAGLHGRSAAVSTPGSSWTGALLLLRRSRLTRPERNPCPHRLLLNRRRRTPQLLRGRSRRPRLRKLLQGAQFSRTPRRPIIRQTLCHPLLLIRLMKAAIIHVLATTVGLCKILHPKPWAVYRRTNGFNPISSRGKPIVTRAKKFPRGALLCRSDEVWNMLRGGVTAGSVAQPVRARHRHRRRSEPDDQECPFAGNLTSPAMLPDSGLSAIAPLDCRRPWAGRWVRSTAAPPDQCNISMPFTSGLSAPARVNAMTI